MDKQRAQGRCRTEDRCFFAHEEPPALPEVSQIKNAVNSNVEIEDPMVEKIYSRVAPTRVCKPLHKLSTLSTFCRDSNTNCRTLRELNDGPRYTTPRVVAAMPSRLASTSVGGSKY
jgi:hypothetical protein